MANFNLGIKAFSGGKAGVVANAANEFIGDSLMRETGVLGRLKRTELSLDSVADPTGQYKRYKAEIEDLRAKAGKVYKDTHEELAKLELPTDVAELKATQLSKQFLEGHISLIDMKYPLMGNTDKIVEIAAGKSTTVPITPPKAP